MPQTELASESSKGKSGGLEWAQENVVNPFLNAAWIEPINSAVSIVNHVTDPVTHRDALDKKEMLPTSQAQFMSTEWFAQGISGGIGSLVPYVIAGQVASKVMRSGMLAELPMEKVLQRQAVTQTIGAGAYDFARDPRQGETRLGNAASGVFAFSTFALGGALSSELALSDPLSKVMTEGTIRAAVGFVGGSGQQMVSHLVSDGDLPTVDQLYKAGIGGAAMNLALPATQKLAGKAIDAPGEWMRSRNTELAQQTAADDASAGIQLIRQQGQPAVEGLPLMKAEQLLEPFRAKGSPEPYRPDGNLEPIVIGSGPAGLSAALYLARGGHPATIIDGMQQGGQLRNTTVIENYPGFPDGVDGNELMDRMRSQAEHFGTKFEPEIVESIDVTSHPFKVKTSGGERQTDSLIIATGAVPKMLGLPNETGLMGHGVSVCATCDGFFFKGKDVFVVGGGNTAMEDAIFLTKFAKSVTVLNRSNQFRADKIMLDRARSTPKLTIEPNSVVDGILSDKNEHASFVSGIKIRSTLDNSISTRPADGIFIAIGHTPMSELVKGQMATSPDGYIVTNNTAARALDGSPLRGVYAAGDVQDPEFKQAVTASADGVKAAMKALKYLEGTEVATSAS